ncbi:N-acetylmuramoyl-L-alanine amidase [Paenibacillus aurantiacus]|uniref:N-acetylmuramoyl-L-alanine amidase n=1 Tax=Paenibacillus aurantiacus TaxID=1936118 RepID=A0ABV5L1L3_9BACL
MRPSPRTGFPSFPGVASNRIETFTAVARTEASHRLATEVQRELIASTGLRDRGVKAVDFYVICKTRMPAILTECGGFMTNREEAALMKADDYRRKVAHAIVNGIAQSSGFTERQPNHCRLRGLLRCRSVQRHARTQVLFG